MADNSPVGTPTDGSNSTLTLRPSPAESSYTMSQCIYEVSMLGSQHVLIGFMATSLVINFGIIVSGLTVCYLKRKIRRQEEWAKYEEDPDGSDTEDEEMDYQLHDKEAEGEDYQSQQYPARTDRDSSAEEARQPHSGKRDRSNDPPLNEDVGKLRGLMNDRYTNDLLSTDKRERRGKQADVRKLGHTDRDEKEDLDPDISESGKAAKPSRRGNLG